MYKPLIAHTITITEAERRIILAALDDYLNDAEEDGQWTPFTEAISDLHDRIFHEGEDDE